MKDNMLGLLWILGFILSILLVVFGGGCLILFLMGIFSDTEEYLILFFPGLLLTGAGLALFNKVLE